jgi:putative ABC transport system substrate-binding protein
MRRRQFISALAGAATAWPSIARAQRRDPAPLPPTIGLLHSTSLNYFAKFQDSVRQGLSETGWTEGQGVRIEYRWAEGKPARLPALAQDLVSREVAVIFAVGGSAPAQAAKAATSTIPIVFISAADPIKAGLVASLSRPGGNVTGVSLIGSALEAKRLGLLNQLVPDAAPIGVLINPNYPDFAGERRELQTAADALKRAVVFVNASTVAEIDAAFAALARQHAAGLVVAQDILFNSRNEQITALAARYRLPAIYNQREYSTAGGLISYGPHFADGYRQAGVYLGKILNGEKPADLPVQQPTRFEMVINLKAAHALDLTIPPTLLALADEVIE